MEKIVFIHTGLPKTGTTSLQHFFTNNREQIFKETNIYYPDITDYPESITKYRQLGIFPIENSQETWKKLSNLQRKFPKASFLFSVEEIFYKNLLTQEGINILRNLFNDHTLKIIIFLRRIDEFVVSLFFEEIRQGNHFDNLESFIAQNIHLVSQSKILEQYCQFVGRDNVLIGFYEKGRDSVKDFFSNLKVKFPINCNNIKHKNISFRNDFYPFLAKPILPKGKLRRDVRSAISEIGKILHIFETQDNPLGNLALVNLDDEVNKINAYAPGYKNLFDAKPVDFSFSVPHPEASDLLAMRMLYAIRQENALLQEQMQEIKALLRNHVKDSINH